MDAQTPLMIACLCGPAPAAGVHLPGESSDGQLPPPA